MLEDLRTYDFDKIYGIIRSSFPEDEYRSYEEQKKLLDNKAYGLSGILDEAKEIKGFLGYFDLDAMLFIEHLVVTDPYRDQGIGGLILQEFCKLAEKPVVLEVELPVNTLNQRRIGFYERNGFVFNAYEYTQPAIDRGRRPIPLALMTRPEGLKNREEFEFFRQNLYKQVYGIL